MYAVSTTHVYSQVLTFHSRFRSFVECDTTKMAVPPNLPDFDDKLDNIKRHVIRKRHSNIEKFFLDHRTA